MKQIAFFTLLLTSIVACTPASTADVDYDGETDVHVKGNKAIDVNIGDNILIVDGLVVNAITNEQWYPKNGNLALVKERTFSMKYNPDEKKWNKIPLKE